jgi:hypothetical protein
VIPYPRLNFDKIAIQAPEVDACTGGTFRETEYLGPHEPLEFPCRVGVKIDLLYVCTRQKCINCNCDGEKVLYDVITAVLDFEPANVARQQCATRSECDHGCE